MKKAKKGAPSGIYRGSLRHPLRQEAHSRSRDTAWRWPVFFSGVVLLSQAFPLPSPVLDAASGLWASGFSMQFPFWHLLFTPFCGLADTLTVLSVKQAEACLAYLALGGLWGVGWRRYGWFLGFLIAYAAWGALVPRPMARLVPDNPGVLLIDFHSHTCYSHDGRPGFTPEANMRWHEAQGYGASFITDHNRIEAAQQAKAISRANWRQTGYRSLQGEEVSLYKTHLILLGNHERVDNQPYDSDTAKIPLFVADMHQKGWPVIASLPEYWLYHWGHGIEDFVRWGMNGFEIVNSAPKALDFPSVDKRQIVYLCRLNHLPITGISDNHGYGYATAAWNAMLLPDWRQMDPDQLESAVLKCLKERGFEAVQVLERARYEPSQGWRLWAAPWVDLGYYWRSLHPLQALSWIAWIWILFIVRRSLA